MPGLTPEEYKGIRQEQASAMAKKQTNRKILGSIYDQNRSPSYPPPSTPMDPQDHPANNVMHPHGNRGSNHATVPLNVPTNIPSSTGDYQDEINY